MSTSDANEKLFYSGAKADAIKMWRALCDEAADPAFSVEFTTTGTCFVTGTLYDGRRKEVQVSWDADGPYVWEHSDRYRFMEVGHRKYGMLVLQRRGGAR